MHANRNMKNFKKSSNSSHMPYEFHPDLDLPMLKLLRTPSAGSIVNRASIRSVKLAISPGATPDTPEAQ
jgi:hypothetical protein